MYENMIEVIPTAADAHPTRRARREASGRTSVLEKVRGALQSVARYVFCEQPISDERAAMLLELDRDPASRQPGGALLVDCCGANYDYVCAAERDIARLRSRRPADA